MNAIIGVPPLRCATRRMPTGQPPRATTPARNQHDIHRLPFMLLLLALMALAWSGQVHANCSSTNNPGTVTFTPPGGQITLSGNDAVGTVLWTSNQATPANYPTLFCSDTTNNGVVSSYGPPVGTDQTLFPTNLSWLSFRILHPDTTNVLSAYPNNASVPTGFVNFSVASALQLVMTGPIPQGQQGTTQQMTIPAGKLAQWNVDMTNGTAPVEIFNVTNITFVIPTCTAAIDPTVVTLSAITPAALPNTGSVTGLTPFNIRLNCAAYNRNLRITLDTARHTGTNSQGIISPTTGNGYANNVGIQLLQGTACTTPVKWNSAISEGNPPNGEMDLPFCAQYYRTSANAISTGTVTGTATYTLNYQ